MQASVLEWLDHISTSYPDRLAIVDEHEQFNYEQYHDKSIGIARAILDLGITGHKPIVVYLEKSIKVLPSFMGIAYSGNFYSPIDTTMPAQRVNKILEVLKPELVITSASLRAAFETFEFSGDYIIYEDIAPKATDNIVENATSHIIDTDLLYVLFTSGSTGTPKGVCITHRSVIDYIDWVTETFEIVSTDIFGNQAPFYFDNSILDIYSTLKTGAMLHIIPSKLFAQPIRLLEFIKVHNINTIFWVPSALMVVSKLKAFRNIDLSDTLQRVLFCGETMPNKQLNIWRKYLPNVTYANLYGPTEITDACTFFIVNREFTDEEPLPIGFPMKNTDIIVLDEANALITEPYITGELCVRGTSIAMGYYNNSEKSNVAFTQNPLNAAYEEKIYHTGDLVQYNSYHELIYLSRKDFQIKHMGHRIELGEIESAVSSLPNITMCCCLYDEKRNRIVLFLDQDLRKEEVNAMLKTMLPEYMLPGKVFYLETLPLNANGKIDRTLLKEYLL